MAFFWVVLAHVGVIFPLLAAEAAGLIHFSQSNGKLDINALDPFLLPLQLALVLVAVSRLRENPFQVLALDAFIPFKQLAKVAGLTLLAIFAISIALLAVQEMLGLGDMANPNQETVQDAVLRTSILRALLFTAILTPIVEEVMFRGVLLQSFASTRLGFWGAAVVSSILFAMVHGVTSHPLVLAPYFVIGMACAWSFRATGSLWAPIGIHMLKNSIAVFAIHAG
jgi:membrane protease YdiL (CAAX protease family)